MVRIADQGDGSHPADAVFSAPAKENRDSDEYTPHCAAKQLVLQVFSPLFPRGVFEQIVRSLRDRALEVTVELK